MLTADDLSYMRSTMQEILPDTCTIKAPVKTSSGTGRTITYTDTTDVPCRLGPMGSRRAQELFAAGMIKSVEAFVITLPYNQTIAPTYRIAVDGGDTYEVIGSVHHGGWTLSRRVECEKIG